MSRTKRAKSPDVDAIEEDEQQYANGPLSLAELDEQYASSPSFHSPLYLQVLTPNPASPTALGTTPKPPASPISSPTSSTP